MKTRIASFFLAAAVITAFAAPNLFDLPDKFRTKYPTPAIEPGGETHLATTTRALYESPSSTGAIVIFDDETETFRDITGADLHQEPFLVTATLTSAAAATAVELIPDSRVPSGRKVYVAGYMATVNGATDWATTASVKIQDKNASAVDFVTFTASELDGNEIHIPGSTGDTLESAMKLGTGGTAAKGLQVKGDANGTGSNLVVTVWGIIR